MSKHRLVLLGETFDRLNEQGGIDKDTLAVLQRQRKILERALATKNHSLVKKTVSKISQVLLQNLRKR